MLNLIFFMILAIVLTALLIFVVVKIIQYVLKKTRVSRNSDIQKMKIEDL